MQDKTAKLDDIAVNFVDMARQLREREKNKKWWQL